MLAIAKQKKYIQKAVKLPNGDWAMVVFELIEREGHVIARAVSGKVFSDNQQSKADKNGVVLCLPCRKSPSNFIPLKSTFYNLVSTFQKDFSFVTSQPTRAPAIFS